MDDGSEGRTERWVKWGVGISLAAVGTMFSFTMTQQARMSQTETQIAVLQEWKRLYSIERMDMDRGLQDTLKHMSEQSDQQLKLLQFMAGDDTYQREVQRERQRYHTDRSPVFGVK